jgi:hypothetical protein
LKILQINITPNVPLSQLMEPFNQVAPVFAAVPGLVWKIWSANEETGIAAGIYYFKDQTSLDTHLGSDLHKGLFANPAFEKIEVKTFDVLEELSKVTRAPI